MDQVLSLCGPSDQDALLLLEWRIEGFRWKRVNRFGTRPPAIATNKTDWGWASDGQKT